MVLPLALLVLDFEGVCTLGVDELRHRTDAPALADVVRADAIAVVTEARAAGVTTAVLSNELSPEWIAELPVLAAVDHVVVASDNGILKPDRRAFLRCALLAGCEPEQVLVVDDGADNITVAASIGMHTVHFDTADPDASWSAVRELLP